MTKRPKNWWGFKTRTIDASVRPQDNFYLYANGGWLKRAKIPKDESRWGSFVTLRVDTEHQLKAIMDDLLKRKAYPKGSPEQMASDYYRAAFDMKTRNALGMRPLEPLLKTIDAIQTKKDLLNCIARFHVLGISVFWGAGVDQDSKKSTEYIVHLVQDGLGLPDRDYYLEDKPEQKRVRDAYLAHIEKLLRLGGTAPAEARHVRKVVMNIEMKLAGASMKKEDLRDPEKTYHKRSLAKLKAIAPAIDWKNYFARTNAQKAKQFIVCQPKFFAFVSTVIQHTPLEDLKTYMRWHLVNESAGLLSEAFVKEHFAFYGTTLSGAKTMKPLWRRALAAANGALGDALGKLYVAKHFPPASKRAMDALVDDLFAAYAERIKTLDWMSAGTKRKALTKLKSMNRKIGYPAKWRGYRGLNVAPQDYYGNVMRSTTYEHYRNMNKLGKPIDRSEWFMYPQTVNAYFLPTLNDIAFPAAILQWPFFDAHADAAVNYAAIGSVIGHEITHGFDDQGAKFDAKGTMRMWWIKKDVQNFTAKTKPFIAQADKEIAADGVHINGKLTLGENIADSGGLIIAYDAYQNHLKKTSRKVIGGLSPEERFFFGFAQTERELARPELLKLAALTDPHAAAPWRINGPLSNFEPFYQTFNVTKGDNLYREPKTRAQMW
ncbi:MAG: M13 family metallopeptidase [Minisyncoccia bacterium]|jgi:predicted metalloendopeptidase